MQMIKFVLVIVHQGSIILGGKINELLVHNAGVGPGSFLCMRITSYSLHK